MKDKINNLVKNIDEDKPIILITEEGLMCNGSKSYIFSLCAALLRTLREEMKVSDKEIEKIVEISKLSDEGLIEKMKELDKLVEKLKEIEKILD